MEYDSANQLANPDGSHWAGSFTSNVGAVTGCTREQVTGRPEELSASAARGCAGQMIVSEEKPSQKGGYGFSYGDKSVRDLLPSPHGALPNFNKYLNIGINSDLSHKAYNQNSCMKVGGKRKSKKHSRKMKKYHKGTKSVTRKGHKDFETYKGSKRYSEKRLKKLIGRKTMRSPIFPFAGGKKKFHKGTKSVTRKGHKDFETYKGSKRYSEKRLKKLIGRKTMRSPIFPFAGGKKKFHKGTKSVTRKGHKDFETYKGSKRYSEKRLKKLIGRKTMRSPIFPYAGGYASGAFFASGTDDQLIANRPCSESVDIVHGLKQCGRASSGPQLTGGAIGFRHVYPTYEAVTGDLKHNLKYGGRKGKKNARKPSRKMSGGYCQYMSNQPFSLGYSTGSVELGANNSALANPVPYTPQNKCVGKQ